MSDTTNYTLAVWSLASRGSWVALATSDKPELISSLHCQFAYSVWWPATVVEVPGGTDDDVVAALRLLPRPIGWAASNVADRIAHSQEQRIFADAVHPPGDPNV